MGTGVCRLRSVVGFDSPRLKSSRRHDWTICDISVVVRRTGSSLHAPILSPAELRQARLDCAESLQKLYLEEKISVRQHDQGHGALTDVVQGIIDRRQGGRGAGIAHGGGIRFVDTGQAIAATVKADRTVAGAFGLFAPAVSTCLSNALDTPWMERIQSHVHRGMISTGDNSQG